MRSKKFTQAECQTADVFSPYFFDFQLDHMSIYIDKFKSASTKQHGLKLISVYQDCNHTYTAHAVSHHTGAVKLLLMHKTA